MAKTNKEIEYYRVLRAKMMVKARNLLVIVEKLVFRLEETKARG